MKGLIIHDLNTKETVGQIIERFKNEYRNKMWSDCFKPKFTKPKNKRR